MNSLTVTVMHKARYFITYILLARWEKGGTQRKMEFFERESDMKSRLAMLQANIRIGSIKIYEIQEA